MFAAVAALLACRTGSTASPGAAASQGTAPIEVAPPLPPGCVQFLAQLQCWLRASGNAPEAVTRAVGNARAVFEAHPDAATTCERAASARRPEIGSAGCNDVNGDLRELPASSRAQCPPDEHFFIRRDGRVSGCHPDCATSDDCPRWQSCTGIGTAAGGPIDEPFCE